MELGFFIFLGARSVKSNWRHAEHCGFTVLKGRKKTTNPKGKSQPHPLKNPQNIKKYSVLFRTRHIACTLINTGFFSIGYVEVDRSKCTATGCWIRLEGQISYISDFHFIFSLSIPFYFFLLETTCLYFSSVSTCLILGECHHQQHPDVY